MSNTQLNVERKRIFLTLAWSFCTTIVHMVGFILRGCEDGYCDINVNTRKQFFSACDKFISLREQFGNSLNSLKDESSNGAESSDKTSE